MIRSLRAFFLSRALREKLLLVAFIAIGVMWWGSAFSTRAGGFWRDQRLTSTNLVVQAEWLKNKPAIDDAAQKTAARLDPTKTLNGNQLVTTVSQLANEAGLKGAQTNGNTVTKTEGQFAVHSQEFTIRTVEWDPLKKFYEALQQRSPYIAMERFILQPLNTNGQHVLNLKVTSVEITR
jgi:hypothetical protein